MGNAIEYPFVYDEFEIQRLAVQGRFFAPLTAIYLSSLGLENCQTILDVGCGGGDFAKCISKMAPHAHIVGIDRDPTAIDRARSREISNAEFIQCDIEDFEPGLRFDAVLGRFVLLYSVDPTEQIRTAKSLVKEGGLVGFLEPDHTSYYGTSAPNAYYEGLRDAMFDLVARCNVTASVGLGLRQNFEDAGLPGTSWITLDRNEGGPEASIYEVLAGTAAGMKRKSLSLMGQELSHYDFLSSFEEIQSQLRTEAVDSNLTVSASRLIGVWSRLMSG